MKWYWKYIILAVIGRAVLFITSDGKDTIIDYIFFGSVMVIAAYFIFIDLRNYRRNKKKY